MTKTELITLTAAILLCGEKGTVEAAIQDAYTLLDIVTKREADSEPSIKTKMGVYCANNVLDLWNYNEQCMTSRTWKIPGFVEKKMRKAKFLTMAEEAGFTEQMGNLLFDTFSLKPHTHTADQISDFDEAVTAVVESTEIEDEDEVT